MSWLKFSHVALSCRDPIATEEFYCTYFGFRRARVIPVDGASQVVFLRNGDVYLELFAAAGASPAPPAQAAGPEYSGVRHLAFQVDSVDAKLAELGADANVTAGPLDFDDVIPGWRTVWITDPDGTIVEISQGYVDQENPPA